MTQAETIIERFGGTRALARALCKPPTTVQSWKDSGLIPSKHHEHLMQVAREKGVDLRPDDFFASQPERAA